MVSKAALLLLCLSTLVVMISTMGEARDLIWTSSNVEYGTKTCVNGESSNCFLIPPFPPTPESPSTPTPPIEPSPSTPTTPAAPSPSPSDEPVAPSPSHGYEPASLSPHGEEPVAPSPIYYVS